MQNFEIMKKIIIGLFVFGLTIQAYAQVDKAEKLPEVVIHAVNYKYLNSVNSEGGDISIDLLEQKVANYDIKDSDVYVDEYQLYNVSFYIPDGYILAAYDVEGRIIHTIEKFKNSKLPSSVVQTINDEYPGWSISRNVYRINYSKTKGVKKRYKFTLDNGYERIKIKIDEKGKLL
jgi:hypothetical protein